MSSSVHKNNQRSLGQGKRALSLLLCAVSVCTLAACVETAFSDLNFITPAAGDADLSAYPPTSTTTSVKKRYRINSEKLLEADGNWNLVEQGREYDPAQANLAARKKVDVHRKNKMNELSPHFKPDALSNQDVKMRVLRLEKNGAPSNDDYDAYEVAETTFVKPSQTVVGQDMIDKITSMFDDAGSIVTPPPLPQRRRIMTAGLANLHPSAITPPQKPMNNMSAALDEVLESIPVPTLKPVLAQPKLKSIVNGAPPQGALAKSTARATAIRAGKHPGKTRMVIEVSDITRYKVAIDHIRNVLRIKMEDTNWAMEPQGTLGGSPLLGSYTARPQNDGSVLLEIRLKAKSEILDTMLLRPNTSSLHRVVIDLKG